MTHKAAASSHAVAPKGTGGTSTGSAPTLESVSVPVLLPQPSRSAATSSSEPGAPMSLPYPLMLGRLDGVQVAIPVQLVSHVLEVTRLYPVPFAREGVCGAVVAEGRVVFVVDVGHTGGPEKPRATRSVAARLVAPLDSMALALDSIDGVAGFAPAATSPEEETLAAAIRETLAGAGLPLGPRLAPRGDAAVEPSARFLDPVRLARAFDPELRAVARPGGGLGAFDGPDDVPTSLA
jgi:chemotaxis signal transduction protein